MVSLKSSKVYLRKQITKVKMLIYYIVEMFRIQLCVVIEKIQLVQCSLKGSPSTI